MAISLLLADDSPTIAKILGMALQNEDYEIRSVLTADEALRELKGKPPYFFLVDLSLPGKNGFEFAELIRADSKLAKIKIVFLSSAFEPVDEEAVKKSGADLVIAKPFDPSELRASLRQLRDAPPKFPSGAKVQGALSGQVVTAPVGGGNTSLTDTGLRAAREVIAGTAPAPKAQADDLLLGLTNDLDANSILAGLDGSAPPAEDAGPPPIDLDLGLQTDDVPPPMPAQEAAALDLGLSPGDLPSPTTNPTLDLTGAFTLNENALENLAATPVMPPSAIVHEEPPAFAPKAPPPAAAPPSSPPKAAPAPVAAPAHAGGLSANAEALAAFFAAEIDSKQPATPPPPPTPSSSVMAPPVEEFEKSMASIEWDNSSPADLDAWSSQPMSASAAPPPPSPKAAPAPAPKAAPASPRATPAPAASPRPAAPGPSAPPREATRSTIAPNRTDQAGPASFMFDTGDSNFRFAEDYITRITKSFTGQHNEEVPERHHSPMFPQHSDDTPPPPAAPAAGLGGAWNQVDAGKMEQIVREEVQMAVREIVEKVAWEVIPELAENIIKRELEKVMKQLEANS